MKKNNFNNHGFVKVSAVSPELFLAQPLKNAERTIEIFKKLTSQENLVVVFPELSLTGYTCEDLFHTQDLIDQTLMALEKIVNQTKNIAGVLVVGHPYQSFDGKFFNCASVISEGKILAMVPKIHRPNYGEFYEKRWFTSGYDVSQEINLFGQSVLLSPYQAINLNNQVILGVEICEDLWAPNPPSTNLALNGVNLMVNLSASNELINKAEYRRELINQQSARLNCGYIYASSGAKESTKDVVFGGHCLICENGTILGENERFSFTDSVLTVEIDFNKLALERRKNSTFGSSQPLKPVKMVHQTIPYKLSSLQKQYSASPFVPQDNHKLQARSEEILQIQATGLARRIISIGSPKIVLGLSGGLDSTLALLVALEALKKLKRKPEEILCISMPGFGTSRRTKDQASRLAQAAGVSFKEIDITDSVKEHFKAINHSEDKTDVVYENSQARERTQILFDMANKVSGIVLGTGDLSELALGWATFNGDHMANYNVNGSIPKTLVKHLVSYYKNFKTEDNKFKQVLTDILNTKISPELLPLDRKGNIQQDTEEVVGPYLLHDFFLFHYLRNGFTEEKIKLIAERTFKGSFKPAVISKWHQIFFKRFKQNQFKRTTLPPGPKVGSVSLSPRGDWRCPDEQ